MKNFSLIAVAFILFQACSPGKKAGSTASNPLMLDTLFLERQERPPYNESRKRVHDLLHTKLDVKFDYEKKHLLGRATLTLKPYFYSTNKLELDAKGMNLHKIVMVDRAKNEKELKYVYDGSVISIDLGKTFHKADTFNISIEYTAKPDEREAGGSDAITSDKGLYFINADGKDLTKPIQIWTQGETEANSVWFPTIDSPNERMSQELFITVDKKYATLSNGMFMFSLENGDGTRTDYWKQDLAHAPYLTMMAIGEYAIVKDKWKNLDVHYYVEKDYEPYAKAIFGNTPEMLEFFSNVLGVKYPWDKYHQVIVRDYVSGAMENTGAVIFGEFMNKNTRELLDDDNESIIAHELFHHWFGDLVTCESWANLPLNESFATYGEYLWIEHKYGRDEADYHLKGNLDSYLMESRNKQADMIRFDYEDKEDMFDSHSYAKGGRILHMLRKYVGDEAFFESLKLYLTTHQYTAVEIHELRLAFEKVTGEDLNWFFNQWFLSSGHPELVISSEYKDADKKLVVKMEQVQQRTETPVYRLPVDVDVYVSGKKERHRLVLDKKHDEFVIDVVSRPDLVNVDAEKMLLCLKDDNKSLKEWAFQYSNAPLFIDRYEALEQLAIKSGDPVADETLIKGLSDPHWGVRLIAIKNSKKALKGNEEKVKQKLIQLASKDNKSDVRMAAIRQLSANFKHEDLSEVYLKALNDSSYSVVGEAIGALAVTNEKKAFEAAKGLESEKNNSILTSIAALYAKGGDDSHHAFFMNAAPKIGGYNKYTFIGIYGRYLKNKSPETVLASLPVITDVAQNSAAWWIRMSGVQVLGDFYSAYSNKAFELKEDLKNAKPGTPEEALIQQQINAANDIKGKVHEVLKQLKEKETDKNLQRMLSGY
jgi:aminopeptidase N